MDLVVHLASTPLLRDGLVLVEDVGRHVVQVLSGVAAKAKRRIPQANNMNQNGALHEQHTTDSKLSAHQDLTEKSQTCVLLLHGAHLGPNVATLDGWVNL